MDSMYEFGFQTLGAAGLDEQVGSLQNGNQGLIATARKFTIARTIGVLPG